MFNRVIVLELGIIGMKILNKSKDIKAIDDKRQYLLLDQISKSLRNFSFFLKFLRLKGGGKKRKKKVYTKPKKNRKVKKKTSLKVLEYYELKKGSIVRTKKESPSAPGCIMAEHQDRLSCGKTGLSFLRKN